MVDKNIIRHHAFIGGNVIWAVILMEYDTNLHIFKDGSLTSTYYLHEVLDPIVIVYAAVVCHNSLLMDDNARPQQSSIVEKYLESEGISRLKCPMYFPGPDRWFRGINGECPLEKWSLMLYG